MWLVASALAGGPELSGFVRPAFSMVARSTPIPEDRLRARMTGAAAGLVITGEPVNNWSYKVYFLAGGRTANVISSARTVDGNNDGRIDGVETTVVNVLRDIAREASIRWQATPILAIKAGQMPIPFTSNAQSPDTKLLFPERASPTGVFLADDDLGALAEIGVLEQRVQVRAGLFNGTGVAPDARGVLLLARADLALTGEVSHSETDPTQRKPEASIGGGVMFHPYGTYDGAGFLRTTVRDLRVTGSARVAASGFSLAVEGLFRSQQDNLTLRPLYAAGGYLQLGMLTTLGIEPIARAGVTAQELRIDPRMVVWTDVGLNVYPVKDDEGLATNKVKVTIAYQGEHRLTEAESAHGATAAVQIKFD